MKIQMFLYEKKFIDYQIVRIQNFYGPIYEPYRYLYFNINIING